MVFSIRMKLACIVITSLLIVSGCGDPSGDSSERDGASDTPGVTEDIPPFPDVPVTGPHPLYPALDLDALPGNGGAASGPYQIPLLPSTSRTVIISSTGIQAADDLEAACRTPGTAVLVNDAGGELAMST